MNHFSIRHIACIAAVGGLSATSAWACSSCGCTLNSDWASQGYHTASGFSIDLRQDYYDQDQLRSGTSVVSKSSLELPNEQEVQLRTTNRNTLLSLDYGISRTWGVHLQLPYFNRSHDTIPEGETEISHSHSSSLGDVRFMVRYQGFSPDVGIGVEAGLKLPTGGTNVRFSSGPAQGELVDRGLQPGTGATDLLVGVHHFGTLGTHLGYSTQAVLQQPLNSHDAFKVGTALNLNAGLRYLYLPYIDPQLQFNVRIEGRETGTAADRDNSGATLMYLSPGATVYANLHWQVYGFVQLPVYQRVNGLQIQPSKFYSVGVHYTF